MLVHILDEWKGHTFAKSDARPSRDEWEYQILLELVTARVDGLPVSFRVPEVWAWLDDVA